MKTIFEKPLGQWTVILTGVAWVLVYLVTRELLDSDQLAEGWRILVALAPMIPFAFFLIFMLEATRYLDLPLADDRVAALRFMIVGAVLMALVVFRPQGVFGRREELTLRGR